MTPRDLQDIKCLISHVLEVLEPLNVLPDVTCLQAMQPLHRWLPRMLLCSHVPRVGVGVK